MRYLSEQEERKAKRFFEIAICEALKSKCLRSKGGSIIEKKGKIIGRGYNSPPLDRPIKKCFKNDLPAGFKSDATCCLHAEQRAIIDALKNHSEETKDSRIYFIRLNKNNEIIFAGDPYCTICSKLALDVGIKEFILWHKKGICSYETEEYNQISFGFKKRNQARKIQTL